MNGPTLHKTAAKRAEELPERSQAERPVDPHAYGARVKAAR